MLKEFLEARLKYYEELFKAEKKIFDDPETKPLTMRYSGCRLL